MDTGLPHSVQSKPPNTEIGSTAEDQLPANAYQDSPFGSLSYHMYAE